ncbi:cysteine hydrolase family protein [Chromohalobacter israelensis]|uniref:cysteine hydrolase family protein n=1 Tax=Chromohalobacter israelensis TaxID=141390 RepID=UPI000FFF5090|nr:isochorismatase family protein [Chromohalobacter salexigens]RXE48910.1 hypothetical protein B4O83_13395 [Chromohalobacter salexigens]
MAPPRCQVLSLHPHEGRSAPSALLVVAMQQVHAGLLTPLGTAGPTESLTLLLKEWRGGEGCIVHVRHFSRKADASCRAGRPEADFLPCATPLPGERVVTTHVDDPFVDTDLDTWLRRHGVTHLVVAGVTTTGAIMTLTRHALTLGFDVTVVADACADQALIAHDGTRWEASTMHELGLALLERQGAEISSVRDVHRTC